MPSRVFSFWSGPVTWMERLSCASAVDAGHEVTIFTYDVSGLRSQGLNAHIEDARDVLPASDLSGLMGRAPDHFSDWFRVEGLAQGRGSWLDLDVVVLRHLGSEDYLMSWERPASICNAVLRLPSDSKPLARYAAFCRKRPISYAPHWYPLHTRLNMQWKRVEKWVTGKQPPRLHYGPAALTHFVCSSGASAHVLPQAVYYPFSPMHLSDMQVLTEGARVEEYLREETRAVHLWRRLYRQVNGSNEPSRDCWLGRTYRAVMG